MRKKLLAALLTAALMLSALPHVALAGATSPTPPDTAGQGGTVQSTAPAGDGAQSENGNSPTGPESGFAALPGEDAGSAPAGPGVPAASPGTAESETAGSGTTGAAPERADAAPMTSDTPAAAGAPGPASEPAPLTAGDVSYSINGAPPQTGPFKDALEAVGKAADDTPQTALAATITLMQDITLEQTAVFYFASQQSDTNVTITSTDGQRYTLYAPEGEAAFVINGGGQLTLRNVTVDGGATVTGAGKDAQWSGGQRESALISLNSADLLMDGTIVQNTHNTGGGTAAGGGVYAYNQSTVELTNNSIIQNCRTGESRSGGGIYAYGTGNAAPTIKLTSGIIQNNYAEYAGGGIYANGLSTSNAPFPKIVLINGAIRNNYAGHAGGGVYAYRATFQSENVNTQVSGNYGGLYGGGLYLYGTSADGTVNTIEGLTVANNESGEGGGIYLSGTSLRCDTSAIIEKNKARNYGGGIRVHVNSTYGPTSVNLSNVVIRYNEANHGGGLYLASDRNTTTLAVTQVIGNRAAMNGGGIYLSTGTLELKAGAGANTGVLNNTAVSEGGGIYIPYKTNRLSEITTLKIGTESTVRISGNSVTGAYSQGGAMYLGRANGVAPNRVHIFAAEITGNTGVDHTTNLKQGEESCGGVYVGDCSAATPYEGDTNSLILSGTVTITGNTVSKAEGGQTLTREANLLIDNTLSAYPQTFTPVQNNQWAGGLSQNSKIGVSMTKWPGEGEAYMVAENNPDASSSGNVGTNFTNIFASDYDAYNENTQTGMETVVQPHPAASRKDAVYLTCRAKAAIVPQVTVNHKYYDGTADAVASSVQWSNLPAGVTLAPEDYTVTASFASADVAYEPGTSNVTPQTVTGTVTVTNGELTSAHPELAVPFPFRAEAAIYPIPLTASLAVEDKYFDGTTSAQVRVNLAVDAGAAPAPGLTLPGNIPSGYVPAAGTDYTVGDAQFTAAQAAESVAASAPVTWGDTALAKNYTLNALTAAGSAKIWPLPVIVSFGADDRNYEAGNSAAAVTAGSVSVRLASQPEPGAPALPPALPVPPVYQTDFNLENVQFVDAGGAPTDQVGTHRVTATVAPKGAAVINYIWKEVKPAQAAIHARAELAVVLDVRGKPYDGTVSVPAGSYSLTFTDENGQAVALVENTDYRVLSGPMFSNQNAGERTVSMTIELAGTAAGKYMLANGNLTAKAEIAKKALIPSVTNVPDKAYDGTARVVSAPADALTVSLSGWIAGEQLHQGIDYTVSGQFGSKGAEAPQDAADGKPVAVTVALTDSALAQNYYLSSAMVGASANITKRPLTVASATVADKLYDGTADATVMALSFSNTLEGEPLTRDVDWRIVSAQFDTANTGLNKPVRVVVELLGSPVSKNYVLAQDWADAAADITNHLDVYGAYTGEVSSGSLAADEIDSWVRANFAGVLPGKPQVAFLDKAGNAIAGIDKSKAGEYTVEATYSNANGQTVTYHINWTLAEKPAPEPAPTPSAPAPSAPAPIGVQTGDSFPLVLLAAGFVLAAAALAMLLIVEHKKNQSKGKR